jgi:hypothetical protein
MYDNKTARNIIKRYMPLTAYGDGTVTLGRMYQMLRFDMGFGNPEAQTIIAALSLAGAVWATPEKPETAEI